jgi:hypothetical protein
MLYHSMEACGKDDEMSIEKVGHIGASLPLNPVAVSNLDMNRSSTPNRNVANQDDVLTLDQMKELSDVRQLTFEGADLNGDGIVSQKEAIIQNAGAQPMESEAQGVRETMKKVFTLLAQQDLSQSAGTADSVTQRGFGLNFSQTKIDELLEKIDSDVDLSILA